MVQPVLAELTLQFAATPDELWPYVADTNRFNRSVGLPEISIERAPTEDGVIQTGEIRALGFPVARWLEHPFEWERPKRFSVVRDYSVGPVRRMWAGAELTEVGDGTSVRLFAELTPSSALFAPLIKHVVAPRQMQRARAQFETLARFLQQDIPDPFPALQHAPSAAERERVADRSEALLRLGCDGEIVSALADFILTASDEDVSGMRPLELAQRWRLDSRATLETCLHAATIGLLEMRWELLCPSCRGMSAASLALHDLLNEGICAACNLHFTASADEAIEARFYPASSVRPVTLGMYCVGGPMRTPHRHLQFEIPPGGQRDVTLTLDTGSWIVLSPQSRGLARLVVSEAGGLEHATVRASANLMMPDQVTVAPGATVSFESDRSVPTLVSVDDARWTDLAATPGRLLTYPAFRSLFSAEALAPGVELAVGHVGLLFTDLAGSTALYEKVGDAVAFRLVSEHFTVLREAIERNDGALVKTIGDAVMAAFPNGARALQAAFEIQRGMLEFDTRGLADASSLVKIGVHAGPCFVVTLNGQLDYFGTTVNLAARAQGEARGGEVVATAAVRESATQLAPHDLDSAEEVQVTLRGISQPVSLVRFRRASSPVTTA